MFLKYIYNEYEICYFRYEELICKLDCKVIELMYFLVIECLIRKNKKIYI